jgi:hypothetical protein
MTRPTRPPVSCARRAESVLHSLRPEVEYDLPKGLFAGVAEKVVGGFLERDLRHSMENFKALCEATVPVHA